MSRSILHLGFGHPLCTFIENRVCTCLLHSTTCQSHEDQPLRSVISKHMQLFWSSAHCGWYAGTSSMLQLTVDSAALVCLKCRKCISSEADCWLCRAQVFSTGWGLYRDAPAVWGISGSTQGDRRLPLILFWLCGQPGCGLSPMSRLRRRHLFWWAQPCIHHRWLQAGCQGKRGSAGLPVSIFQQQENAPSQPKRAVQTGSRSWTTLCGKTRRI